MIKPARKYLDDVEADFVVCDIENDRSGKVLAIGITYRHEGRIVHSVFHTWAEFISWLKINAKEETKFRTVYAHNGGGWDWVSLVEYLMGAGHEEKQELEIARAQSTMILLELRMGVTRGENDEKGEADLVIKFCDSLYLLRSKLDKLSQAFLGRGKTETDINEVWKAWEIDKPRFYEYLRIDCENLLLVLEAALRMLREKVAPIKNLGLTIGATAMSVWRTGFLEKQVDIPTSQKVKDFLREGYRGGRVEVFRYGYFPAVNVYDINSLYPAAMVSTLMPASDKGDWSSTFRKKLPGCYRIKWKQKRRDIFPVLMIGGYGAYEGEGVFFSPELHLLMEVDPGAEIRFIDGYCFYDTADLFSGYVNTLYNLRLADPDGPIAMLAKFLLNSLYGKFCQKSRREQVIVFESNAAQIEYMKMIREKDKDKPEEKRRSVRSLAVNSEVSTIEFIRDVGFEHVGIGGMITSQARALLYRLILKAGCQNVIYSDTDSVHCTNRLPEYCVGTSLGQAKAEFSGEGVYAGKKLYALRNRQLDDPKKREKIRAKGITVGGNYGADISFDDICLLTEGAEIECHFSQPASVIQVLKRADTSCRIGGIDGKPNRKRTIQMLDGKPKKIRLERYAKQCK